MPYRKPSKRFSFARILKLLAGLAGIVFIFLMMYGFLNYPAAPIREQGGRYLDKEGKTYTLEQFKNFSSWEDSLAVSGISVFALAFAGIALERIGNRNKDNKT